MRTTRDAPARSRARSSRRARRRSAGGRRARTRGRRQASSRRRSRGRATSPSRDASRPSNSASHAVRCVASRSSRTSIQRALSPASVERVHGRTVASRQARGRGGRGRRGDTAAQQRGARRSVRIPWAGETGIARRARSPPARRGPRARRRRARSSHLDRLRRPRLDRSRARARHRRRRRRRGHPRRGGQHPRPRAASGSLTLSVTARDGRAMFVGVAAPADVDPTSAGAPYDVVVDLSSGSTATTRAVPGTQQPAPPSPGGVLDGERERVRPRRCRRGSPPGTTLVVMNADAPTRASTPTSSSRCSVPHAWAYRAGAGRARRCCSSCSASSLSSGRGGSRRRRQPTRLPAASPGDPGSRRLPVRRCRPSGPCPPTALLPRSGAAPGRRSPRRRTW